ncbi:MAG: hypothetical protein KFB95_02070 [Simkaniaceae bacterium]|nr:MAG: hypothetical protein KFB95_02070 [Simkaniaceae bacterium]
MKKHPFIFKSGSWIGEGKITLSMMDEELAFYTRWKVPEVDKKGRVDSLQEIQISGLSDVMQNQFAFYDITRRGFHIELENQSLGKVVGKGMISDNLIGWEFRLDHLGFEGFEFYEKGDAPGTYLMHAEYSTNDDFRTVIHGKIWRPLEDQNELEKSN